MDRNKWIARLVLVAFVAGCAGGLAARELAPPAYAANPSAARWEQFCEIVQPGFADFTPVNEQLKSRGAEGWELVGLFGQGASVACFKRPAR